MPTVTLQYHAPSFRPLAIASVSSNHSLLDPLMHTSIANHHCSANIRPKTIGTKHQSRTLLPPPSPSSEENHAVQFPHSFPIQIELLERLSSSLLYRLSLLARSRQHGNLDLTVSILLLELNPKYIVGSTVSRSRCRLLTISLACLLAHYLPRAGTCEFGLGDVNGCVDVQSLERGSERR